MMTNILKGSCVDCQSQVLSISLLVHTLSHFRQCYLQLCVYIHFVFAEQFKSQLSPTSGSTITRIDQIFSRYARAKWFIILVKYNIFVSSWTSPYTHRQCSGKEHVEELLHFITELKSKSLTHHHMPAGSKLLVQNLFNRFRTLKS